MVSGDSRGAFQAFLDQPFSYKVPSGTDAEFFAFARKTHVISEARPNPIL
jgi:hypothetical protein